MQTRHQLAILAGSLLIGTQIGIAAIGLPIADTEQQMEPVPPEAQVEQESASAPEETQPELTAATEASQPAPLTVAEPIIPVMAPPQPVYAWERTPPWGADEPAMLPALVAYLDRTAHLRVTGASGGFPPSTDDKPLLPALAAYFDRQEATRLAAQKQQLARVENASPASDQPVMATAPSQPQAQDIAALDGRSPSSTGTPF